MPDQGNGKNKGITMYLSQPTSRPSLLYKLQTLKALEPSSWVLFYSLSHVFSLVSIADLVSLNLDLYNSPQCSRLTYPTVDLTFPFGCLHAPWDYPPTQTGCQQRATQFWRNLSPFVPLSSSVTPSNLSVGPRGSTAKIYLKSIHFSPCSLSLFVSKPPS